jgi:hypothetical protein
MCIQCLGHFSPLNLPPLPPLPPLYFREFNIIELSFTIFNIGLRLWYLWICVQIQFSLIFPFNDYQKNKDTTQIGWSNQKERIIGCIFILFYFFIIHVCIQGLGHFLDVFLKSCSFKNFLCNFIKILESKFLSHWLPITWFIFKTGLKPMKFFMWKVFFFGVLVFELRALHF